MPLRKHASLAEMKMSVENAVLHNLLVWNAKADISVQQDSSSHALLAFLIAARVQMRAHAPVVRKIMLTSQQLNSVFFVEQTADIVIKLTNVQFVIQVIL
jgi:hypothetical protein